MKNSASKVIKSMELHALDDRNAHAPHHHARAAAADADLPPGQLRRRLRDHRDANRAKHRVGLLLRAVQDDVRVPPEPISSTPAALPACAPTKPNQQKVISVTAKSITKTVLTDGMEATTITSALPAAAPTNIDAPSSQGFTSKNEVIMSHVKTISRLLADSEQQQRELRQEVDIMHRNFSLLRLEHQNTVANIVEAANRQMENLADKIGQLVIFAQPMQQLSDASYQQDDSNVTSVQQLPADALNLQPPPDVLNLQRADAINLPADAINQPIEPALEFFVLDLLWNENDAEGVPDDLLPIERLDDLLPNDLCIARAVWNQSKDHAASPIDNTEIGHKYIQIDGDCVKISQPTDYTNEAGDIVLRGAKNITKCIEVDGCPVARLDADEDLTEDLITNNDSLEEICVLHSFGGDTMEDMITDAMCLGAFLHRSSFCGDDDGETYDADTDRFASSESECDDPYYLDSADKKDTFHIERAARPAPTRS